MSDSVHLHTNYSQFDAHFMQMALREAEQAAADGEVPLGCVLFFCLGFFKSAQM